SAARFVGWWVVAPRLALSGCARGGADRHVDGPLVPARAGNVPDAPAATAARAVRRPGAAPDVRGGRAVVLDRGRGVRYAEGSDAALVTAALGPRLRPSTRAGRDGLADGPHSQHAVGDGHPVHRGRLLFPRRADQPAALQGDTPLPVRAENS